MDRRSFILEVFDGARHERLPRAIFGGGLWAYAQAGLSPEDVARAPDRFVDALSGIYGALDTDMLFLGSGLNSFPAQAIGGALRFAGAQAPLLERPLIRSAGDLALPGEIDLLRSPATAALVGVIEGVRRNFPDRFLCATSWGPFTWAMILCDGSLLKEKLASDKPFVAAVTDLGMRLAGAFFDLLIDRRLIDGVCVPDGATTLIPAEDYRELVLPRQRELFERLRRRGVRSVLHVCGNIGPQLALYPRAGADCISVDSTADIGAACRLFADATVTAGNVDAVAVLRRGDEDAVTAAVAACVARVPDPHRRYILMPSCDLPIDTPRRNVAAFLAAAANASGAPLC